MKSTMTETKFIFYTISAIFLLMLVRIFQEQLSNIYNPDNYLGIHTLLEVVCIAISAAIFLYGLKSFSKNRSSRMILLAFTFLTIGMIDLLHMLSYKGMPFFITESSVAKATWFWIAARMIQSFLMLSLLLVPDWKLKRDYRVISLLSAFVLTGVIGFIIFSYETTLPMLVIEGDGTTLLKNGIEYFVSFILFISLIISLYHYYLNKNEEKLTFALGFVFLLLTELVFTIYQSVFDLDNFLGHIFKVYGFYFILNGFYFSKYTSHAVQQKTFSNQPGLFFTLKKQEGDFICLEIDGEWLKRIGFNREDFIGRPFSELFSATKASINDYCNLALKLQKCITFEMEWIDKSLLISIKPSIDEEEQDVILGTVIDMTGILSQKINPPKMKQEDNKGRVVM